MPNPVVYIIYSESLDTFYVGETADLAERLTLHKTSFFKDSHTSSAGDYKSKLSLRVSVL